MKINEIAESYNFDTSLFTNYLINTGKVNVELLQKHNLTLKDVDFNDSVVAEYVNAYKEEQLIKDEEEKDEEEKKAKSLSKYADYLGVQF